ncbi:RWP-RK domain - like 4 [Theobroma cacao]|nr:RWP-RK domain - like 4 [Theobroma cacao]
MDSTNLNFPKLVNAPDFDWFNFEENPFGTALELLPFEVDGFYDFNDYNFNSLAPPGRTNYVKFKDFEDISGDFALFENTSTLPSLHEDILVDAKPLKTMVGPLGQYCGNITNIGGSSETLTVIQSDYGASSGHGEQRRISGRKRTAPLELDEIQKYFDFPISKAAKEMNVGLTVLKKRCRELNIMRWPHRKIKSLTALINNVKELGLTNEIMMLEDHKRLLEKLPDMELTERTKKLRQACFKANYKKRRSLAACY